MAKKPKPPIKFTATLRLQITTDVKHVKVSKKVWDTLPKERRSYYMGSRTVKSVRGYDRTVYCTIYREDIPVPPYDNPAVERLRRKLKQQRVAFMEMEDAEYITFHSINNFVKEKVNLW